MNLHKVPVNSWTSWHPEIPRWTVEEMQRTDPGDFRPVGRLTDIWQHPDTKAILAVWERATRRYVIYAHEMRHMTERDLRDTKRRIEQGAHGEWRIWRSHTMENMHAIMSKP